ncbi:MAG: hypothetical protein WCX61_04400 [Candidatus Peribacteraceae bacterium]|jgi:hypothetical protein
MDQQGFINAVKAMKALPTKIIRELTAMAPILSDEMRRDVLYKFRHFNKQLRLNHEETLNLYEKGQNIARFAQKKFAPRIRNACEKLEQEKNDRILDHLLDS